MKKGVRMADIAERLNISVVTVSKALAGKSGVSEELRAKVVSLARQMGYESAKVLTKPIEDKNIGVLVSERCFSRNTFYTNLYRALLLASGRDRPTCIVEIITKKAEHSAILPNLIVGKKVDGIIFMGDLSEDYLRIVAGKGLPCLLLDSHVTNGSWSCVVSDNANGGCALTQHLLSTGRQNIGFAGSISTSSNIMDRYLGYQKALYLSGISPKNEWLLEDLGKNASRRVPVLPDPLPHAFVCSSDEVAYDVVEILQKNGLRIPEDVAVCGYGDINLSSLCRPQLTTYQVDVDQMASLALNLLVRMLLGEQIGSLIHVVPGHLVVRESTSTEILRK